MSASGPAPDVAEVMVRVRRLAIFQHALAQGLHGATTLSADVAWIASALAAIHAGADPAEALGLRRGPGKRKPATTERTRQRDDLLRRARADYFGDMTVSGASRALLATASRCERLRTPPSPGTPEAAIAAAAKVAALPTTSRMMSRILQTPARRWK